MKILKRNLEGILAFIGFGIVIWANFCFQLDEKIFFGLLGTIATLYLGHIKLKIENDKLFKELFQDFNSRYDERFNDLINELKYDDEREITKTEINILIDYFNLCAEEFLWKEKSRIPNNVWNAWKSGIIENLKIKQVQELYKKETSSTNGRKSFYGLIKELENN